MQNKVELFYYVWLTGKKRQVSLLCMTWHNAYPILVMYTVGTGAIITFLRMFLSNKIITGINLCEAMEDAKIDVSRRRCSHVQFYPSKVDG